MDTNIQSMSIDSDDVTGQAAAKLLLFKLRPWTLIVSFYYAAQQARHGHPDTGCCQHGPSELHKPSEKETNQDNVSSLHASCTRRPTVYLSRHWNSSRGRALQTFCAWCHYPIQSALRRFWAHECAVCFTFRTTAGRWSWVKPIMFFLLCRG